MILFCVTFFFSSSLMAQSYLARMVSIKEINARSFVEILKQIEKKNNFYFSYNSHVIPSDSLVSMPEFHGTLRNFLERLIGPDYDFKEIPGYVIIRYVPGSLYITFQNEKRSARRLVLNGCVQDLANGKGIAQASVYERKILVSTLTDKNGNFELKIKHPDKSLYITVNKNNYRDTTIVFLLPIEIYRKYREDNFFYYPDDGGSANGVERSAFARFFISSKQMIQGINLGGFFAHSPYQVSLTPGLSSHGMFISQIVNDFSLNIIGGYTAGVNGIELAGAFNIDQKDVKSLQLAGIFNTVGNDMSGLQAAGVSNTVFGEVSGVQIAGVNNWACGMKGVQLSGIFNVSKELKGLQMSGCMNISSRRTGSQVAGLFNIGKQVKGIQVSSLLNIADSCDYPIGLINIIRKGRKSLSVESCESGVTGIVFRSGGRVLYSLMGMGYDVDDQLIPYVFDVGLGVHVLYKTRFSLDIEQVFRKNTDLKKKDQPMDILRFLPGFRLGPHVSFFAGPSVNFVFDSKGTVELPGLVLTENKEKGNALYIGCTYGVSFNW